MAYHQQQNTMGVVGVALKDAHQNYLGNTNAAQPHLDETTGPFRTNQVWPYRGKRNYGKI